MIRLQLFFLLSMIPLSALAGAHGSDLPSTVPGLTIHNAHAVDRTGHLFRGQQPLGKTMELVRFGITDVIILKPDSKGEVASERQTLSANHVQSYLIPMQWDESSPVPTCEMAVQAVNLALSLKAQNKKVFLHCSAGEDRTGLVSGLLRMKLEGWNTRQAFEKEMCANGYGDSDPGKPVNVNRYIQTNLTPIFLLLAKNISNGSTLDKSMCQSMSDATIKAQAAQLSCHSIRF